MKKFFSITILAFFLSYSFAAPKTEAAVTGSPDRVRIAECYNSAPTQFLLMSLSRSMSALGNVPPVWQTLPSGTEKDRYDLKRAGVIGMYDMIFSGSEEHVENLKSQEMLLGKSSPLFTERIIIVGPPEKAMYLQDFEAEDVIERIFKKELLCFNPYRDVEINKAFKNLLKQAGVSDPAANRRYVETGRVGMDALIPAGDEGGFAIVGEASFAQYEEFQRGEKNLVEICYTGMDRTSYVLLVASAGFRKERMAAAERYFEWLLGEEGRRSIEDFEIGGMKPFSPAM